MPQSLARLHHLSAVQVSMKMNQQIIENKGFTIVEVMIALAIFSIGYLAYSGLQIAATKANTKARWLTLAVTCATDKIEQLLDLPYTHADLAAGTHTLAHDADGIPDPPAKREGSACLEPRRPRGRHQADLAA